MAMTPAATKAAAAVTRPAFQSTELGRTIRPEDLADLTFGQLCEVSDELAAELTRINGELRAGMLGPECLQAYLRERAFLAPFHQKALRIKQDRRTPVVQDVAAYFLQVCRNELEPATYQRLLLIAETRRATEMSRVTGLASD